MELKKKRVRTMRRKRSQSRINQDPPILEKIWDIKAEDPLWGHRRVWAYLRYRKVGGIRCGDSESFSIWNPGIRGVSLFGVR